MRRLFIVISLLAVVAAACGGSAGVAATVDGQRITAADVADLVHGDPDSVTSETFAVLLFNLVADEVFRTRAEEDFSITVGEEEFTTEREAFIAGITAQGQTLEEVLEANDATETRLDLIVAQRLLVGKIVEALVVDAGPPTDAEIDLERETQSLQLSNVCASHILLENEADAQAALDRALAGEDFAALAQELSTGPSGPNGGDLGCGSPANYVPSFANATMDAEIGMPSGPVESDFGFHVILVTERTEPTRDALITSIDQRRESELLDAWRIEVLTAADVEIDEQYGTWVTEPLPQILPPDN